VRWVVRGFGFVFLAVMLVAAYGFFTADDQAIETSARVAACAGRGPGCRTSLARFEKTPFYQDRKLRVGNATVVVRCARTGYLIGEYRCAIR
jgi:hypothetical protein